MLVFSKKKSNGNIMRIYMKEFKNVVFLHYLLFLSIIHSQKRFQQLNKFYL